MPISEGSGESERERGRRNAQAKSLDARDIGDMPKVAKPKRKSAAKKSLAKFCTSYFPAKFYTDFSPDHLTAIARIEECVTQGGLFTLAMFRGGGKTELCKAGCLWALMNGYRRFAVLVGATDPLAEQIINDLKRSLSENQILYEDYPEVCFPIWKLDGESRRCIGQTCGGVRTQISWKQDEIRFPIIDKSVASGAIIRTRGITGAIRGQNVTGPKGESMRPDIVFPDDVQTRESAKSLEQTNDREMIVNGDILKLAGHRKKIAMVMPCTCIYPGDLTDRFLDHDRHPECRGERFKAVYSWPVDTEKWDTYAALRKESFRAGGRGQPAVAYLQENFEAMHAGSEVAWDGLQKEGDLSPLHSLMDMWIDTPEAFDAEMQNTPRSREIQTDLIELTQDQVKNKLTSIPRMTVPRECNRLTAFVDVQQQILFYAVCAWDDRFGGSLIDYGAFPRQNRDYFTAADARPKWADLYPGMQEEAAIWKGLGELAELILPKAYQQADTGADLFIERCLIDARYKTPLIAKFCRESQYRTILLPSQGFGITAAKVPVNEWPRKEGERRGWNWTISAPRSAHGRIVKVDTNLWKSFVGERLRSPIGTPGCLSLFGSNPATHQLLAEHLTAEYRTITSGRGRTLEEWQNRPGRIENHWWDAIVGCAVGASVQGLIWSAAKAAGGAERPRLPKKKIDIEKLYEEAQKQGAA